MKKSQPDDLMEKKIKRTNKGTDSAQNSREERTIIITIFVAFVIMGALVVSMAVLVPVETEHFTAMYVLDAEKMANNYPTTVVLGQNSTFTLWVGIENQNDHTIDYSVQLKLKDGAADAATLIDTYNKTVQTGETWETQTTITINHQGSNTVIFELWTYNTTSNDWDYTGTRFNFSIQAIQQQ